MSELIGTCDTGGGGSGFYGITVAETDGLPTYPGIVKVNFESDNFYLTQNAGNTDEVVVSAVPNGPAFRNFSFEIVNQECEIPYTQQMVVHEQIDVTDNGFLLVEGTVVVET
jgi:hypothetical protein